MGGGGGGAVRERQIQLRKITGKLRENPHPLPFPSVGCANAAPRLSLFHRSVSGPHGGGGGGPEFGQQLGLAIGHDPFAIVDLLQKIVAVLLQRRLLRYDDSAQQLVLEPVHRDREVH